MIIASKQDLEKALKPYGLEFHEATAIPGETLVTFKFNWYNKWYKIKDMKRAHKDLSPCFIIGILPVIFKAI
jgi:hypothetical protein